MSLKDKVLASVEEALKEGQSIKDIDLEGDAIDKAQAIIDSTLVRDLNFIESIGNTYYGKMALIEIYNPKWFSENLFSSPVLMQLIEALISCFETEPNVIKIPALWTDLKNGNSTPIKTMIEKDADVTRRTAKIIQFS